MELKSLHRKSISELNNTDTRRERKKGIINRGKWDLLCLDGESNRERKDFHREPRLMENSVGY